jgi:hypothetical protein
VCYGGSPLLIRQVAKAVRRLTEARQFSEKMANRFVHGDNERLPSTSWRSTRRHDPDPRLDEPGSWTNRRVARYGSKIAASDRAGTRSVG